MTREKEELLAGLIVGGAALLLFLGIWVFASAMEARAYNNVTGGNVSTWDAMWIELRVQAEPKSR